MPQLDGSFIVNDAFENVDVRFKDDKAFLDYSTLYAKWSEEIITLSDKLVLRSGEKMNIIIKTGAINLIDGEETK
jgi:hypothetical protein